MTSVVNCIQVGIDQRMIIKEFYIDLARYEQRSVVTDSHIQSNPRE